MARIPVEDVDQIWRQMGENKDWANFMKTVMRQCGKTGSLDILMVDRLVREAYDLKNHKTTFPESPEGLYTVLAENMTGD